MELVRELPITGFAASGSELIAIPTDFPIRELRIQYDNVIGDFSAAHGDPFSELFQYMELLFDSESQWKITNWADLCLISMIYTGKPPKIAIAYDNAADQDNDIYHMTVTLPVQWRSSADGQVPKLKWKYQSDAITGDMDDGTFRINYVHTKDTSRFERLIFDKVEKAQANAGKPSFKPEVGETLRGIGIYCMDDSIAELSTGQRYSLEVPYGGVIGLDAISFKHNAVEYLDESPVRDIIDMMERIFPLVDFPVGGNAANDGGSPSASGGTQFSPFGFQVGTVGADSTVAMINTAMQSWLYYATEDLKVNVNTLLTLLMDNAGNNAAGDVVAVTWIYKAKSTGKPELEG